MKCYKCGNEGNLKNGLCSNCYKELTIKKNKRKKQNNSFSILANLKNDEKLLHKAKNSNIAYAFIFSLLAISIILFPRTIIEFFFRNNKTFLFILLTNISIFLLSVYLILYFLSREILLTNKNIVAKWGIFKVKSIIIPLNKIEYIDTFKIRALEINTPNKMYVFDYIANAKEFKFSIITQIKNIIQSATDDDVLMSFSHSLNEKLKEYELEKTSPNMTYCSCCKKIISKYSTYCVHCGQPILENQRTADLFLKLICFLIPPFGIIIFLIHIGKYPKMSRQCIISSMLSLFLISILYFCHLYI